jgi:23S rRNA A2030 N6-methylase RlmJ
VFGKLSEVSRRENNHPLNFLQMNIALKTWPVCVCGVFYSVKYAQETHCFYRVFTLFDFSETLWITLRIIPPESEKCFI